jgi:hypothetical protein
MTELTLTAIFEEVEEGGYIGYVVFVDSRSFW